ncbi:MAG: cobalamin biosynthesis protein [Acetobacteraceae bacterium]|nr:cobalamin biosynthesis protein [Acetobacteraceae bacterium]
MADGNAGDAMGGDEAMIVAGVGFRRSVEADELVALVRRACDQAALAPERLVRLATVEALADEPGFQEAARRLAVEPAAVEGATLRDAAHKTRTHSARSLAAHGVGSVAEAAALGGAGVGADLVLARITSPRATCALAKGATP